MQWRGRRESGNVEDGRGFGGGRLVGGGIGAAVLGLIVYLLGGDPSKVLPKQQQPGTEQTTTAPANDTMKQFVGVVLADTEDVWNKLFADMHKQYQEPHLRLFTDYVQSGCGNASQASGPFYCPLDRKVYIDLSFFRELKERFSAPGDFAMAYVVAHEVGHHVQNLLGVSERVQRQQQQAGSEAEANRLSVMLELQADFLAGVWAHYDQKMKDVLDAGDVNEALTAASAIGDDKLQEQSQGYVVPDAFTHGTSAQRVYWFKKGYQTGDINQGNTFEATDL